MKYLPIIVLLGGAILPIAIIMLWVYSRDKLREPVSVVLLTMLFGGLVTIPILIVEFPLSLAFGVGLDMQINTIWQAVAISFVVAALVEELFKFGVLRLSSARHSAFDEPFDGIVYGIAASLGFALIENIGYVLISMAEGGFAEGAAVAIGRAIFAVPMHASCGVIMGACIGLSRFGGGVKWSLLGILLAIAIHGTYDTFLFSMEVPHIAENTKWVVMLFVGAIVTTMLSVIIATLIIIRFRRNQLPTAEVHIVAFESVEVDSADETQGGVPVLPLISLILTAIATALPIISLLLCLASMDQYGDIPDGVAIIFGLSVLASLLVCVALLPVSIASICIQPRWKAASIFSFAVALSLFCIELLVLVIGSSY